MFVFICTNLWISCIILQGARCTVDYIFKVVVRLEPLDEKIQFELVQRILSVLTHQNVIMDLDLPLGAPGQSVVRRTSNLTEMGSNLAMKLTQFFFHVMHVQGQQLQAAKASEEEAPENKKPDGTGGKKRSSRVQKSSKHWQRYNNSLPLYLSKS